MTLSWCYHGASTSHHSRSAGCSPPKLWIAMTTKSLVITVFSRGRTKAPVPTRCKRAPWNALAGPRFFSLMRQCYSRSFGKQGCCASHARSSPSVDRPLTTCRCGACWWPDGHFHRAVTCGLTPPWHDLPFRFLKHALGCRVNCEVLLLNL